MRRTSCCLAIILIALVVSFASSTAAVSAQDVHSDRSSIGVVLVSGNDKPTGGREVFGGFNLMVAGISPESGLGLNLTVRSQILHEADLGNARLLIISMPNATTIPNSTVIKHFLDSGGSLFLLSDYYGGGLMNFSAALNSILGKTSIVQVAFGSDAIFISNSSPNWQTRVYRNNTLAVKVNSTMFEFSGNPHGHLLSPQTIIGGLTGVVTLSCSLNITSFIDPTFVARASAQSDSGLPNWLLLIDDGTHRSALCGSASMFNDTYLSVEGNQALLRNLVLWLVQNFQMQPPNVFLYMALVSSAMIVIGAVVYRTYRKRASVA
ncbi:MAG: hypothetical protein WED04_03530 [Promethearchaeati archaeon SRVP18_Atabeyarchaeia-1]